MAWRNGFWLVVGLALIALPGVSAAQINPTLSGAERGIKGGDEDASEHLRIEQMAVTAKIVGRTADVTVELLIGSDSDTSYEADLALELPADAVVTGYALNVGQAMIPGQLLESPKARNVYEDEVRAGIDPGLAEVSSGNRFTTRIFPITREAPRRISVSFVAPFDPVRGLILPFERNAAIGKIGFNVTVDGYSIAPTVSFGGKTIALTRAGQGWRGGTSGAGLLRDGLSVSGGTLTGAMIVTRHSSGESFFAISDGAATAQGEKRSGRLRVYWDRSLSHGRVDHAIEAEALTKLIERTAPTAIDLVTFASDRPTLSSPIGTAGLHKALDEVVYRGGSSLAGLDGLALAPASQCVLVFDGQVTIDRDVEFAPDCALSVLTASSEADGARLGRIAQRSAGTLVRVAAGKSREAADTLARPGTGVTTVRDSNGRRVSFRSLPAGEGRWLIVGRMPDRGGVRVQLSDGTERTYTASGSATAGDASGALWAAREVQRLGDDPSRHQAMVDFARRYHVAGPAMSLLVMERPDQYLRAGIAPPAGFAADWIAEYRQAKSLADDEAADDRRERLAFVLDQWKERKSWWAKRFVPSRGRTAAKSRNTPPAPPPAPAPPSVMSSPMPVMEPSAAASEASADTSADIVVTSMRAQTVPPHVERPTGSTEIKLDLADLTSKRPYITALAATTPAARLKVLGEQEHSYGSLPSFYLDTAEWFRLKGDVTTADLLLLSALELPLSDDETRQIVAFRLERDKHWDRAVELTEQLAAANAEFRPQPSRDLALALAARGHGRGVAGRADLERAFTLLTDAALNPASSDFDGFEVIALMEANALIPDIEAAGGNWTLDPRLVALLDTDVRIVIEWTADDADIDLWVDEPNGERVYYGDKLSSAGGQISNDMTDGYGPEEYAIHRAPPGSYGVRINGYDADRLNPNGPGHVLIRLIRNFARRTQRDEMVDLDLAFQQGRDRNDIENAKPVATLTVEKPR